MIKKVELINFKSHKNTKYEFRKSYCIMWTKRDWKVIIYTKPIITAAI